MKNGWPRKTLGEICGFVRGPFGGSLKKSIFVADGFAVYEQQHAIYNQFDDIRYFIDDAKFQEMKRFELRPNDLIMSCSGTMGKVAIVPDNIRRGIINQALLKLTPSKAVSPEFLKYWMDSTDFQDSLKEQSGGAAIQNVASVAILKEIQISLPSPPEQQRIVGLLDEAFAGIATAKANAEKNLQNASALFESNLHSVFTQRSKGWTEKPLVDLCIVDWGNTDLTKSSYVEGGKFLAVSAAGCDGRIGHKEHTKYTPVLSAIGAQCGRMFLPEEDFTAIKNTITLTPIGGKCTGRFLYRLLTHVELPKRGAAQPFIAKGDILAFKVNVPDSLTVQQELEESLSEMEVESQRLASIYERKLAALDALKKSLLHQAFTGEL